MCTFINTHKMSLNEAIIHCEDTIKKLEIENECDSCIVEHKQLLSWLKELRVLRAKRI